MKESKYSPDNRIVFRETFQDEYSVRKNGIVLNSTNTISNGEIFVNSAPFNLPFIGNTIFNHKNFSIRIKIGSQKTSVDNVGVFTTYGVGNVYGLDIRIQNGKYKIFTSAIDQAGTVSNNKNDDLILTCDGTYTKLYVNGVLDITASRGGYLSVLNFRIGDIYVGGNDYAGSMELIEIYKCALTASEVANLYNSSFNMPAVPYSGQIIGTNVLTNGSFDTTVSGWGAIRGTIEWKEGGYARLTKNDNGTPNSFIIIQTGRLTTDKKYLVAFRAKSATLSNTPSVSNSHWNNPIWIQQPNYTDNWQNYSFIATTRTSTFNIYGSIQSVEDGVHADFDDFVVQELKPQALMLFDATQGGLIDRSGLRTLTATDVITKR